MEGRSINEMVAEEIRVLLARRRISASELARLTGMTQRAISRRLTGEKVIDVDDLEKIARVLDVAPADLLPVPTPGRVLTTVGMAGKTQVNDGSPDPAGWPTVKRRPRIPCPISRTRPEPARPQSPVPPTQRRPMPVAAPGQRIPA